MSSRKGKKGNINHLWIFNGDDQFLFYSFHTSLVKIFLDNHSQVCKKCKSLFFSIYELSFHLSIIL